MFRRILIAVNDSDPAEWAAQSGLDLAAQLNAEAAVIHVVEPVAPPLAAPVFGDMGPGYSVVNHPAVVVPTAAVESTATAEADIKTDADRMVTAMLSRLHPSAEPTRFLREGRPVDEVLATAEEWGADLIIMGTHGRRPLTHLLMGSTSEAVLRKAKCPVMLVHQNPHQA